MQRYHVSTNRGRHQNLWGRESFPPDNLWFGLNTYMNFGNCAVYMICIQMSKWCGMWFVYKCFTDGGRGGLRWFALSAHWLSCIGCWLYLLSMESLIYGTLFLHISTTPGCFCPRAIFSKKQVASDLRFMKFTHYTKDNQQGCSWFNKWFSLWCLGPCMNHLPPVWWSTFRLGQSVWQFDMMERDFSIDFLPLIMFYTYTSLAYHISSQINIISNSFFYKKYSILTFSIDVVSTLSKWI